MTKIRCSCGKEIEVPDHVRVLAELICAREFAASLTLEMTELAIDCLNAGMTVERMARVEQLVQYLISFKETLNELGK